MNFGKMRKAAVLLSVVIGCSAACLTGCKENKEEKKATSIYSPTIPESRVDPDTPGEVLPGKIGETLEYQDKLTVTADKVIEIDGISSEFRSIIMEMTIVNHTDKAVDCQTMTHFSVVVDGKEDNALLQDVSTAVAARRYYTTTGSDLEAFNQSINPGETAHGYVYLSAPKTWSSLKIDYCPYQYYNTDIIELEITEDNITHYTNELK